jgi:histone deacetylase 8
VSISFVQVVSHGVAVLVLGGGGYNPANTARCWARIVADLTDTAISAEIPDTDPFFLAYGPDYEISVSPGCIRNANSAEAVENLLQRVEKNLDQLPSC